LEQGRHALGNIQQISGDENPIGAEISDRDNDLVMPGLMPVHVKITELDGSAAG
jgi:dihydroorotase-like cyclic amidohydrolase